MTNVVKLSMVQALRSAKPILSDMARRLDSAVSGWSNEVTGFGTDRDKTTFATFVGAIQLSDQMCSNLYHGDDLAARMVDVVPDEMLREGFSVDVGDPKTNAELGDAFEALNVRDHLADGIRWGRCFGAGAVLIGADDGRSAAQELIPERSRGISFLYPLDRRFLWPLTWYTAPDHPRRGQVETYLVSPTGYQVQQDFTVVHESRLLVFGGAKTGLREKASNNGWDLSVFQRAWDALRGFNTAFKAGEVMLVDGNQAVFKMQGLREALAQQGEDLLKARVQIIDLYRSVLRALVVDAGDPDSGHGGEDFTRQSVSFEQVPQMLDKFMLRLSAAVQIPVTILMGQSPAGMNATGESDFRWFYDRIRSEQNRVLAPRIRRLVRIMLQTKKMTSKALGDEAIKIKFPPLWSESPSVEATRQFTLAQRDAAYVNAGILLPEEVALSRFRPDGFEQDITLTEASIEARAASLASELAGLEGSPEEGESVPDVDLAPTDIAKVLSVNEVRASQGFGPLQLPVGGEDIDGKLTVSEFAVKREAQQTKVGEAAGNVEAKEVDPNAEDEEESKRPAFGAPAFPPQFAKTDAIDLIDQLQGHRRIIIAGGPRSGKTTLSVRASERYRIPVKSGDDVIANTAQGEMSSKLAGLFDEPGDYIYEGTSMPRALRKWLTANPDKKLDATVVWLPSAKVQRNAGQTAMAKACATVWKEVRPELERRGVTILNG